MVTVAKNVLKAHMLEYLRTVEQTGEDLIVTDNRRPVLRVTPIHRSIGPDELFADVRGKLKVKGDLCEPTAGEWCEL